MVVRAEHLFHPTHLNRRQFIRLSSLFATSLGLSATVSSCKRSQLSIGNDQPVKTGYLPITDAAALLAAYDRGFYSAEGLEAELPQKFRSWDAIANAFMNREVNVVHLLMPTTVWLRYGQNFPGKVVAWNHTNGSAITVIPRCGCPGLVFHSQHCVADAAKTVRPISGHETARASFRRQRSAIGGTAAA